jgi:hypothetical protein
MRGMRRLIFCRSILRAILFATTGALTFTCAPGTVAFAQRGVGHPGGAPHVSVPRVVGPFNFPRRPIYPIRPTFPIFASSGFRFSGRPLSGFGLGLEFNPFWWRNCTYWALGYDCYASPVYIIYGGGDRELAQLYLKDGTLYNVTDYWLVNNQLHFTTMDESDTKLTEHTIDFDQLDLQKTINVATQRGFHFVLRDEPMQQYLRDHPEIGAPRGSPPGSTQPQQSPVPQVPQRP